MNLAAAGPLACVWLDWRERRGDSIAGRVGSALAAASLGSFLAGMLLGAAIALLAWTPEFWRELLDRLTSRLYWGAWELGFSTLLMTAYWLWWKFSAGGTAARVGRSVIALLSATNLLYHFPPLFILIGQIAAGEVNEAESLKDSSFASQIWQGEVLALTVHFWVASLAVAGVAMAVIAVQFSADSESSSDATRLAVWGGRIALLATLSQIPVGLWIVTQVPAVRQDRLLGGDLTATAFLATGVLFALGLLHHLASLAMGEANRKTVGRVALLMLAVIALMTAADRDSRRPPTGRNTLILEDRTMQP